VEHRIGGILKRLFLGFCALLIVVIIATFVNIARPAVGSPSTAPPQCPEASFVIPSEGTLGWPYLHPGGGQSGFSDVHTGIDILGTTADDIYAAYDGEVTRITASSVTIWHPALSVWTYYSHMSVVSVGLGEIDRGDPIGKKGSVGTSIVHLHFSVKIKNADERYRENTTDPSPYLGANVNYENGSRERQRTVSGWCYAEPPPKTPPPPTSPSSDAVDVMLIIDSSGSMATTDPGYKRLQAALTYLTASVAGDRVGVVDFDGTAKLKSGLREALVENQQNQELINAIRTIDSVGSTNIRAGIEVACQELQNQGQATRRGAILLTDGEHVEGLFGTPQKCFED
jgi:hypothetical protein